MAERACRYGRGKVNVVPQLRHAMGAKRTVAQDSSNRVALHVHVQGCHCSDWSANCSTSKAHHAAGQRNLAASNLHLRGQVRRALWTNRQQRSTEVSTQTSMLMRSKWHVAYRGCCCNSLNSTRGLRTVRAYIVYVLESNDENLSLQ
jgi:hypothetical protein